MARRDYREALERSGLPDLLSPFDPHVVGTPPLGLDLPGSDIDIVCEVRDRSAFVTVLDRYFGTRADFHVRDRKDIKATIVQFSSDGWPFEIFGQPLPVAQQHGWRHFVIEQRLIALGGDALARSIMALRRQGLKTEPAFARLLDLEGDPYAALLQLEGLDDAALRRLLSSPGQE